MDALAAVALAGLSVVTFLLARRVRSALGEVAALSQQLGDMGARLAAAEQDAAAAMARAEVAEAVLLEKGLADEDDLEAARRRFDEATSGPAGNGDLN